MLALHKKIEMQEQDSQNAREFEQEKMLKRYHNARMELEAQQKLELTKVNNKIVQRPGSASKFSPNRTGRRSMYGTVEAN